MFGLPRDAVTFVYASTSIQRPTEASNDGAYPNIREFVFKTSEPRRPGDAKPRFSQDALYLSIESSENAFDAGFAMQFGTGGNRAPPKDVSDAERMLGLLKRRIGRGAEDRVKELSEDQATEKILAGVIEELEKPHKTALEHTEFAKEQVKKMVEDEVLGGKFLKFVRAIKARRTAPYKQMREGKAG